MPMDGARSLLLRQHWRPLADRRDRGRSPALSPTFVRRSPSDVWPSGTGAALASPGRRRAARGLRQRADALRPARAEARRSAAATAAVASPERSGVVDDVRYDARADPRHDPPHRPRSRPSQRRAHDPRRRARQGQAGLAPCGCTIAAPTRSTRSAPSGRWACSAKPSRRAYLLLGVTPAETTPPPPTAAATWPFTDVPSLSERPVPADCRRPPSAWGHRTPRSLVAGFAAGGGLVDVVVAGRGAGAASGPAGRGRAGDRRRRGRVATRR